MESYGRVRRKDEHEGTLEKLKTDFATVANVRAIPDEATAIATRASS